MNLRIISPYLPVPLLLVSLLFAGCIGTDFLEESSQSNEPRIELLPEVSAVQVGESITFEAQFYDGDDAPVSTNFSWQSSDEAVATINDAGEVTGLSMGQTRISASAQGITSMQSLLTVVSDPEAVAFVEITPADTSTMVGTVMQFAANVFNSSRVSVTAQSVLWEIDNDSLASINNEGRVTTLMPGIVQITAIADGISSTPVNLEIFPESRTGTFRAAEGTSYTVQGGVTLEAIAGGKLQIRFAENFQSSNGPDLNVYLSTDDSINSASINLGNLQSTRGAQIYTVPDNVSMSTYDFVIIHCLPFNVTFGYAPLR